MRSDRPLVWLGFVTSEDLTVPSKCLNICASVTKYLRLENLSTTELYTQLICVNFHSSEVGESTIKVLEGSLFWESQVSVTKM